MNVYEIEGEFLVSPELLNYWYPDKVWRGKGFEEPFRPTHMIELVYQSQMLASDLVELDGKFAFPPETLEYYRQPLYCFDGKTWWNYLNLSPEWKLADIYVQETKWVEDNSEIGWVYFIREGEFGNVKIGWSKNPQFRLSSLQTANSKPLKLLKVVPGHMSEEKRLHKLFERDRMVGEWFRMSNELEDFLNS